MTRKKQAIVGGTDFVDKLKQDEEDEDDDSE